VIETLFQRSVTLLEKLTPFRNVPQDTYFQENYTMCVYVSVCLYIDILWVATMRPELKVQDSLSLKWNSVSSLTFRHTV